MSRNSEMRLPFQGELMNSVAALTAMKALVASLRTADIVIVSAYMKLAALHELLEDIDPSIKVSILVRWQANDLLVGASDLSSFAYANARKWGFYARQDLHAKIYCIGQVAIFMGSANLTTMGFSLTGHGNTESMVQIIASENNLAHVASLFNGAVKMTDPLVASIQTWLDAQEVEPPVARFWPTVIAQSLAPPSTVEHLMTSECFVSDGAELIACGAVLSDAAVRDLSLLAIPYGSHSVLTRQLLLNSFTASKMYRWLHGVIAAQPTKEMSFGAATAALHSALLDDPGPYRQEVKLFLANLLSWISVHPGCGFAIDRPRHSQRVRLVR